LTDHATDQRARLTTALADRYRIERELGAGGMATVYLAHDLKHERDVAIKVLHPEIGAALGAQRFLLEIKTTANLRHPHIVPLYDSGEVRLDAGNAGDGAQTLLYYVMPVVEGATLRERLAADGQLPMDDALRIAREVAEALGTAHERGVIHRDVKPENILLERGHAVVADFGIARALKAAGGERLTQTGMSIGTPMYMSPEQVAGGDDVDARSDQYSLACVLYEMLAGQPPFTGPNALAITRQHLIADAPLVTQLRPGVPSGVVAALQKALAKSPADRFATVMQFADAFNSAAVTVPRRAWPVPAAIGVVLLAVVAAVLLWQGRTVRGVSGAAKATSVAVLPFADLSPDHIDTHMGDGIAETLINALANVPGLTVTARTSAFALRDKASDLGEIGRQLGVAHVLEGSVQRAGDQLRITAKLIRLSDGVTLWSQRFDRGAADIFAVQDEVARSAVSALQLELTTALDSGGTVGSTRNAAAYDAYLLGRYHWNRRTTEGMIAATAAFKKAVALDSMYAQGWSGLADAYVLSIPAEYNVPGINPDSILTLAEASARRAIALAPKLGEAYSSLGEILEYRDRADDALAAFEQGVALSPKYATGHQWYSYHLGMRNRWSEAIAEMEIAHRLDPLSHVITLSLAIAYDGADRFAEATPLYDQGLAQSPEAWYAWTAFVGHELALGKIDAAIDAMRTSSGSSADTAALMRAVRGLQNPVTRQPTIDDMAASADLDIRQLAIPFVRWLRGDSATLEMLDEALPRWRMGGRSGTVLSFLGPRLRASATFRAMAARAGYTPLDSVAGRR